jgi:hypothetical protein
MERVSLPAWAVTAVDLPARQRSRKVGSSAFLISVNQHLDFCGKVAPAQFWRTAGSDIE